jgi:glucosamine--fructose-6-phosphate aminotransferase (isomerizing)
MCGIIGYCGNQTAAPIAFEALKRVEYRGYDSAGISTLNEGQLLVRKGIGRQRMVE